MEQRLNKAEVILEELLFRVRQLMDCNGFKEGHLENCICIFASPVHDAAVHLAGKGYKFDFPECGVVGGKSTWSEEV